MAANATPNICRPKCHVIMSNGGAALMFTDQNWGTYCFLELSVILGSLFYRLEHQIVRIRRTLRSRRKVKERKRDCCQMVMQNEHRYFEICHSFNYVDFLETLQEVSVK